MLAERGHFLVADASDNNLFTSAKTVYRSLFAVRRRHLQSVPGARSRGPRRQARHGGRSRAATAPRLADTARRAARTAAPPLRTLAQVVGPQGCSAVSSTCFPASRNPAAKIPHGLPGRLAAGAFGLGTDLDGLLVVQNSRGVAAWANGGCAGLMSRRCTRGMYNRWFMGYGGLCRPARAGGIVAVRLRPPAAPFELLGFERPQRHDPLALVRRDPRR